MNINKVKNMFDSLTRVDEIMKENGFVKEKIFHSSETFFSNDTLKIRAQLLTEDLNFYHLCGTKLFAEENILSNENKFVEMVKSVKEKFLLESVSEDFK